MCEDCNKVLKSRTALLYHQAVVHAKGKFLQCDTCDIRFVRPSSLEEHQKAVHDKQKTNQCPDCGKCFSRKRDTIRHRLTVHLKKKPYLCDVCDKAFSRKADLIRHKQLHGYNNSEQDQLVTQRLSKRTHDGTRQQTSTPSPVTTTVPGSMESSVDMLVLASEINAGIGGVDMAVQDGLLRLQTSVPGHQEGMVNK